MSQLQELAELASAYTQQYQTGQLSANDYKELINDLNIAGNIDANAAEFEQNQMYREILLNAINIASAVY